MTKSAGSLTKIAGLVAVATTLSKGMGLLRQLLIAAVFGSGPAYSAFAVAYVLPGFLLVLLGGINGPFHSAIVSILRKRTHTDPTHSNSAEWLDSITTLVGGILLVVTVGLMLSADFLVVWTAPGASATVHQMAAEQLRIMAPLALLAGWIGIGFGALNAADRYLLPSISPLLSSAAVIMALVVVRDTQGSRILAWGTLIGAIGQWLVQIPLQHRLGLGSLRFRFNWRSPEVQAVLGLLLPAVISSGMVHINVYVDLFFASFVPGDRTIGNLGYAQLLIQTPLGILSNVILVPLMPMLASLAVPEHWSELRVRIRQALIATTVLSLPLSLLFCVLSLPIVQLVYQRGRFTAEITQEVGALLAAYGVGMVFYLLRDVLVRVFYALEDGRTPLMVSVMAIGLNALGDYVGLQWFGAPGIALATAAVNVFATGLLGYLLHRRLGGLSWADLLAVLVKLGGIGVLSGLATWILASVLGLGELGLGANWIVVALKTMAAAAVGVGIYGGLGIRLGIPELEETLRRIRARFSQRRPSP